MHAIVKNLMILPEATLSFYSVLNRKFRLNLKPLGTPKLGKKSRFLPSFHPSQTTTPKNTSLTLFKQHIDPTILGRKTQVSPVA
jgi:hypothetical protein